MDDTQRQETELQTRLDTLKNNITLSEGEVKRLHSLRVSEEYAIGELVKEKKWHEEQIDEFISQKGALEREIGSLQASLNAAKQTIDEASGLKDQFAEKEALLNTRKESNEAYLAEKDEVLRKGLFDLRVQQQEYENNVAEFIKEKDEIDKKYEKILLFIQQVKDL